MLVAQSAPIARVIPQISDEAKRFDRGQFCFRQCGDLVATAWKDKVVNMVSMLVSPTDTTSVNR